MADQPSTPTPVTQPHRNDVVLAQECLRQALASEDREWFNECLDSAVQYIANAKGQS